MADFKISLAAARVNAGMTQKEAAKKLNVNVSTMQNWESGKTAPTVDKFIELCRLYGCPTNTVSFAKLTAQERDVLMKQSESAFNELLEKFSLLDLVDQGKVISRIEILLEDERYSNKRRILRQDKNLLFVDFSNVG